MSVAIKASLYKQTWQGDPAEIRRFSVGEVTARSYVSLVEKVKKVFPSVTAVEDLAFAWIDADGDTITISSDEELMQAVNYFGGNLFRLCIKLGSGSAATSSKPPGDHQDVPKNESQSRNYSKQEECGFHLGVICDGCNGPIYGTRYKCVTCVDYDLCSGCEEKGMHVNHNMIAIGHPATHNPWITSSRPRGGCSSGGGRRGGGRGWHGNPFFHGGWGGRGGAGGWGGGKGWGGAGGWEGGWGGRGEPRGGFFFPGQYRKPKEGQSEANGVGPEPMDTEQKGGPSNEDHRGFLRGVGEAVSNFLEPFGVKVDVSVVGEDNSGSKTAELKTGGDSSTAATTISEELVETALAQLKTMGYEDEGGWLRELIKAKGGDVTKVLDALHPTTEKI